MKLTKKQRISRLDTYMEIFDWLYKLEPSLLMYTDWNSNEDSYKQMVERIQKGTKDDDE